jgi:hypothetical protein
MFRLLLCFQLLMVSISGTAAFTRPTTDIEFFKQRWSKPELSNDVDEPSSNSLSIRGGGEDLDSLISLSSSVAQQVDVLLNESNNVSGSTVTTVVRPRNRNLELSGAAFLLSSGVFFAGSHLETVWTTIRPRIGQWIVQQRLNRINSNIDKQHPIRRIQLHKILLGLTIGTFACPTITFISGASALIARSLLLEQRNSNERQQFINSI